MTNKKKVKKKSIKIRHIKKKSKVRKVVRHKRVHPMAQIVEDKKIEEPKKNFTNLLGEVIKKRILSKLVKKTPKCLTGISGFDKMSKGGFESKSINLVAGGSGSGKSIFALQFLIQGMRKGEKVLYVSFEENKIDFYKNMLKLGFDLLKAEKSGKFIFLEYSPEKVKMMLDEGGGAIESIVIREKITRMVIDSITSFSLLFDDQLSKRQSMLGLFDIIRKWNCTTLLTMQYNPIDKKGSGFSSIEFEVDSIVLLYLANVKNKRERFIEIKKMRATDHSQEIHEFDIDKGIKIGKKANIKQGL